MLNLQIMNFEYLFIVAFYMLALFLLFIFLTCKAASGMLQCHLLGSLYGRFLWQAGKGKCLLLNTTMSLSQEFVSMQSFSLRLNDTVLELIRTILNLKRN